MPRLMGCYRDRNLPARAQEIVLSRAASRPVDPA